MSGRLDCGHPRVTPYRTCRRCGLTYCGCAHVCRGVAAPVVRSAPQVTAPPASAKPSRPVRRIRAAKPRPAPVEPAGPVVVPAARAVLAAVAGDVPFRPVAPRCVRCRELLADCDGHRP